MVIKALLVEERRALNLSLVARLPTTFKTVSMSLPFQLSNFNESKQNYSITLNCN